MRISPLACLAAITILNGYPNSHSGCGVDTSHPACLQANALLLWLSPIL